MKKAMEQIMKKLGASESINKPEKDCPGCQTPIKFIQIDHPFEIGEKRWVPCVCECVVKEQADFKKKQERYEKDQKIRRLLKLSSTMDDIKTMNFGNYIKRQGSDSAYQEIVSAVTHFDDRGKLGVFIFGETGNGKSHLTAAGGNELIARGYSVIFLTEKDLLNRLLATKNYKNEESFHEIMSACLEADLLIWDDFLSSQKLSPDEKDWVFQIFNGRERANKPVWITSNLTPEEFESDATAYKLDDKGRTWWRIVGNMECVYNKAANYRKSRAMSKALGISIEEYEKGV